MAPELKKIPYLGLGIGLRPEIAEETMKHRDQIDLLEVIAENYFGEWSSSSFLKRFREQFPIIPHGINLSIGATTPFKESRLQEMQNLIAQLQAPYYSDHFALTSHSTSLETGHLSPLWFTQEMLDHVVRRVDAVQQSTGIPLVLENITAPFTIGEADLEEPEFITEVCQRTGCGLLLDVTNVYINCHNEKKDAAPWIIRYPLDSVIHIHLAGGVMNEEGYLYDTHSREINGVNEGVWSLLELVARNTTSIKALTIERDDDFDNTFDDMILSDLARARKIIESARTV